MRSFWNGSGIIPGDVPTWLAWSLPTFPDQTNPGFHVRFFQSFDSLVLTAAHLFHNIFDREEDIYSSLIVDPVILYGQGDPVQHECIQDLRIRRSARSEHVLNKPYSGQKKGYSKFFRVTLF